MKHSVKSRLQYGCSKWAPVTKPEPLLLPSICRTFSSGGTRIRTGGTMIFRHLPGPLGMRKTRIGKRISVH